MPSLFKNQIVAITGASAGFGEAMARAFAAAGARLLLIARRGARLKALATELKRKHGTTCQCLTLDVRNARAVKQTLGRLRAPWNAPDILVNNAGLVRGMDKLWEIEPADWDEMLDTNVTGVLAVTRALLPAMRKRGSGHVINIGSTSGHGVYAGGGVYCASKFALRALTDTLRMELVDTPLRVSMISPAMARTEFGMVRFRGDKTKAEKVYEGLEPLNAGDIAETAIFIASRPAHVNVADILIYPTNQASPTLVHRRTT